MAQTGGGRRIRAWRSLSASAFLWLAVFVTAHWKAPAQEHRGPANHPPSRLQLSEYHKQVWQVEDGLSESHVRQIAQTADGKLLLATFSGVLSFDGLRFGRVDMPHPDDVNAVAVNAILPGRNGELWVGTDGNGVLLHKGSESTNISERAGLLHERIRTLATDRSGTVWIATQNGIERYADGVLRRVDGTGIIGGDITTVFAETDPAHGEEEGMYFVTSQGLFLWTPDRLRHIEIDRQYGLPVAVYRDRQHRLWLGTAHCVLQVEEPLQARGTQMRVRSVMETHSHVTAMAGDADGNVWAGTRHNGLWRFHDGASGSTAHWSSAEGLEDETIRTLFVDDEDNLWIGMLSGGLSRWRKAPFAPYGQPEGFPSTYAAVAFADSRGDLWLGSWGRGLFRRRGDRTVAMPMPGTTPSTPIRAIAEDREHNLWVGTWFDGVYRYDGHRFQHFRLGIESPVNAVSSLLAHRDGGLWIGTYTGLLHFASGVPGNGPGIHLLENKLVTCLLEDVDGSVLAGTSEGLYRIRNGSVTRVRGMPNPYVLSLSRDLHGNAWAGPRSGGLFRVRGLDATPVSSGGRLANLPIYNAVEDGDGHLWLGTSRGILRVGTGDLQPVGGAEAAVGATSPPAVDSVLFGKNDGMRSSDCSGPSQPSATRLPNGTLWFATTRGFVHTTAYAESGGAVVPSATITGWSFTQDPNAPLLRADTLHVDSRHTDIYLAYDARYLANPDRIEFRYRLKGYDTDWTVTHARFARYQHLAPGSYTFEVQARMAGTDWRSPVAALAVQQSPSLYRTWYFVALCGLLLAAALTYGYHRRLRHVRASLAVVAEERNRIARECHDTLMAGFAAVSWQMEATAKHLSEGTQQEAEQSCDLARSMLVHCQAEARRIIWDLRDSDEITDDLPFALSRAIDAHYRQHSIEVRLNVQGDVIALPPNSVHHLVCIGQEAISNALRHASPTRIDVAVRFTEAAVFLDVRDDGCGFQAQRSLSRHGHFGVVVMEERARKLGGDFAIQSRTGQGTVIQIMIPLFTGAARARDLNLAGSSIVRWLGI